MHTKCSMKKIKRFLCRSVFINFYFFLPFSAFFSFSFFCFIKSGIFSAHIGHECCQLRTCIGQNPWYLYSGHNLSLALVAADTFPVYSALNSQHWNDTKLLYLGYICNNQQTGNSVNIAH